MRTGDPVDRILESLTQINVNLESLRVSVALLTEASGDHEQRLREVERWKHHLSPLLAGMMFILGAVFTAAVETFR